jgi:type II secretory pathway component PulF
MPRFSYEAVTTDGTTITNVTEADNKSDAVSKLRNMGYFPTKVDEVGAEEEKKQKISIPWFSGRIKATDIDFFSYQLSTLINAAVPLTRSLSILIEQIENDSLRRIVEQIKYDVEHGSTLYDALAQHPNLFSELYVNMVKAGETGGVLGVVLERLAVTSERQRNLRNEVLSALIYPMILLGMSTCTIAVLVIFIIPRFTSMFDELGVALPAATRLLIGISGFMGSYWWVISLGIVAIVWGTRRYVKTDKGRVVFDKIKLKIPMIGSIFETFILSRFARTLGTLLENGVVMLPALGIVKETVGNVLYRDAIETGEEEIKRGANLAKPLEDSRIFPPLVTHMIAVGEESGEPEQILTKLADYYDMEIEKKTNKVYKCSWSSTDFDNGYNRRIYGNSYDFTDITGRYWNGSIKHGVCMNTHAE